MSNEGQGTYYPSLDSIRAVRAKGLPKDPPMRMFHVTRYGPDENYIDSIPAHSVEVTQSGALVLRQTVASHDFITKAYAAHEWISMTSAPITREEIQVLFDERLDELEKEARGGGGVITDFDLSSFDSQTRN